MALIKCEECGKEISEFAKICPHCGNDNDVLLCPECNAKISIYDKECNVCGCPVSKAKRKSQIEGVNSLCIGGMVAGICSFLIDPLGIVAVAALIISAMGASKAGRGNNRLYAIIGIACSSIELIYRFIQFASL